MPRRQMLALTVVVIMLAALFVGIGGVRTLLASVSASGAIPESMTYQGVLSNAEGPYTGSTPMLFAIHDAQSAGNKVWEEGHPAVAVSGGYFTVVLGSQGQPLGAAVFSGNERWLQVSVDLGQGVVTLPRQQLHAVPYALRAYAAETAANATNAQTASSATSAISAQTAVTATYALTALNVAGPNPPLQNVINVAKSGGDFTSIQAALDSITNATAANPYLVHVAPGVYDEPALVRVPGFVHLQGAGANVVTIRSTRSGPAQNSAAAAVEVLDNGRISQMRIENTGVGSTFAIGVYIQAPAGSDTVVEDVDVAVNGAGGTGHFAVYLNDAEPTIRNSRMAASGANAATALNVGLGSVNVAGGFPQALVENSTLLGTGSNSGYGLYLSNSAPTIRFSTVSGDIRGVVAAINGLVTIEGSTLRVGSFAGSFLIESTAAAAIRVAGSQVSYISGKHTGTGGLLCIHSYKSNFAAASNGTTPATACN